MTNRPVYQQIADDLSEQITSGAIPAGDRIPSRSELRTRYGASDQTVDRAVRLLKAAGQVDGQFGRGVFVRDRTPLGILHRSPNRPVEGSPYAADIASQGMRPSWESSSETAECPPHIAERLGIAAGDRVMCTQYEYVADRRPVQLATSWEPLELTEGTDIVFPERGAHAGLGVRARMAVLGITDLVARELVGSRPATTTEAETLGCSPGQWVTAIERTFTTKDGRAVETADIAVRADQWRLEYTIPA
jgi:GntR family transcriptional regulator